MNTYDYYNASKSPALAGQRSNGWRTMNTDINFKTKASGITSTYDEQHHKIASNRITSNDDENYKEYRHARKVTSMDDELS